ncbi:hypothetical protein GJ744_006923 [Endocarpon pusillum]|uniref:Amidoligase enzyme n=1 Tax=Endocarpon pusillum TaxID=364733 RepID=A0A8H7ALH3_9EURO|nr:hypothetical protein GJ744_006923 [Endocarpon pusillum]
MSDLGRLDTTKEARSAASAFSGQPRTHPQRNLTARRPEPPSASLGTRPFARQAAALSEASQVSDLTNIGSQQSRRIARTACSVKQQHSISNNPASSQSCHTTRTPRSGSRQYNDSTGVLQPQNVAHATSELTPTLRGQKHHQRPSLLAVSESRGLRSNEVGRQSPTSERRRQDWTKSAAGLPSVAKTGAQFRPDPRQTTQKVPGANQSDRARADNSKIGIGIETEILLAARQLKHKANTMEEFGKIAAINHNDCVASQHPRMGKSVLSYPPKRAVFDQWVLSDEPTISRSYEPWGVEMVSPIFVAYCGSPWRTHVESTWNYLQQYYKITEDDSCATHIHVSVEGGYSFEEIKRVARSAIHFEAAVEALVPSVRSGGICEWAKSSWLDSEHLALEDRSRERSMIFLDTVNDFYSFLSVMNPDGERGYTWNFHSIEKFYTIEFRKPPASITANEVLSWAELAMSFVQASIKHGSLEKLRRIPSTIGGLCWFLEQCNVPGFNEHHRLNRFWEGKDARAFQQPTPMRLYLRPEEEEVLDRRRKLDQGQTLMDAMKRAPYWQNDE